MKVLTLKNVMRRQENVVYASFIISLIKILIIRHLCDGCHDISIKATSIQNLAIIYDEGNAYRINFMFMSKNDAFNLIKNSNIIDKKGVL